MKFLSIISLIIIVFSLNCTPSESVNNPDELHTYKLIGISLGESLRCTETLLKYKQLIADKETIEKTRMVLTSYIKYGKYIQSDLDINKASISQIIISMWKEFFKLNKNKSDALKRELEKGFRFIPEAELLRFIKNGEPIGQEYRKKYLESFSIENIFSKKQYNRYSKIAKEIISIDRKNEELGIFLILDMFRENYFETKDRQFNKKFNHMLLEVNKNKWIDVKIVEKLLLEDEENYKDNKELYERISHTPLLIIKGTLNRWVRTVKISPNGKYIISGGSDKIVKIWNKGNGKLIKTLKGHKEPILTVDISSDSKYIISGSADNTAKFWDFKSGKLIKNIEHNDKVTSVYFTVDGKQIVTGSDKIRVWDVKNGNLKINLTIDNRCSAGCLSSDGKYFASYDGTIDIWKIKSGKQIQNINISKNFQPILSIDFSPDGRKIIAGSPKGKINIWDTKTSNLLKKLSGHRGWIDAVCWSPSGKYIASGASDNCIIVWNTQDYKINKIFSVDPTKYLYPGVESLAGSVKCLSFNLDGSRLIEGNSDSHIRVWEILK